MSPSSARVRFWLRAIRTFALLWLLLVALSLIGVVLPLVWGNASSPGTSPGSGGLAAVSAGISEILVETTLLALVALAVTWLWQRIADRRS